MTTTDPEARWLYQGWCWNNDLASGGYSHEELQPVMAAFAQATPAGRLLVSDMWAEWQPITADLSLVSLPYLYGVLQNFGGTSTLSGSTVILAEGAADALIEVPGIPDAFSTLPGGAGVGAFPEGIDQSPAYYTYLFDSNWCHSSSTTITASDELPPEASALPANDPALSDAMAGWWRRYARERYGLPRGSAEAAEATQAWQLLGAGAYGVVGRGNVTTTDVSASGTLVNVGFWREKQRGGLVASPNLEDFGDVPPAKLLSNASRLAEAWRRLANASVLASAEGQRALQWDLVNTGRAVLDVVADQRFWFLANATNASAAAAAGRAFLDVLADADTLLCTDARFMLAPVLRAARQVLGEEYAAPPEEAAFYERMARAQVTTWLPACANASEFSSGVCSIHMPSDDDGDDDSKAHGVGRPKCCFLSQV
jgi:hypothetical protein